MGSYLVGIYSTSEQNIYLSVEKPLSDFVLEAISELRSTMRRIVDDSEDENDDLKLRGQGKYRTCYYMHTMLQV